MQFSFGNPIVTDALQEVLSGVVNKANDRTFLVHHNKSSTYRYHVVDVRFI